MTKEERSLYNKTRYLANREYYLRKARLRNPADKKRVSQGLAARNRAYINGQKANPCIDCKNSFPPCAMEFDHKDRATKYREVANLASSHWSLKKIQEEIDKCELVCSNCHRIRTYTRKQYLPVARAV